jgi:hypothetical protein
MLSDATNLKKKYDVNIFYTTTTDYSIALAYDIPQGSYLACFDFTILPANALNKRIYTQSSKILSYQARVKFFVNETLGSACIGENEGWTWTDAGLMPEDIAPNLFSDMIGGEMVNIIAVIFILFFVTLLISFVQRNTQLLNIMQWLLISLMILALLAITANAMDSPPTWTKIFGHNNEYVWGIFTFVKSAVVLFAVGYIIVYITASIAAAFAAFSTVMSASDSKRKIKQISFSN